jgi:hypothetical protein
MQANDKNDHDAADIICAECKSIIATLHARRAAAPTKKAAKASEMAAQEIDRLIDPSATDEERQRRKRRLLKWSVLGAPCDTLCRDTPRPVTDPRSKASLVVPEIGGDANI